MEPELIKIEPILLNQNHDDYMNCEMCEIVGMVTNAEWRLHYTIEQENKIAELCHNCWTNSDLHYPV